MWLTILILQFAVNLLAIYIDVEDLHQFFITGKGLARACL